MITRGYMGLEEVTRDYKGFKGGTVGTRGYKRIERVTGSYKGFLGCKGFQEVRGATTG